MKYKYVLYGLKIVSEIKLGVLPITKFKEAPDVNIINSKVRKPRKGLKNTLYKPFTIANASIFYWEVEHIAKYLITGHDTVTIEKNDKADWQDVLAFFYDTCLTVLLIKNDIFVFHASAIKAKGKAYMFCSGSGNGKSTLAALLLKNGYSIIEDDKCLLTWDAKKNKLFIENGIPFMELWGTQQNMLLKTKAKKIGRVRKNIPKIRFDISQITPKRRTPVEKIFLILMDNFDDDQIIKTTISGIGKVSVVKNYSHLEYLIKVLGKSKEHFKYIAQVATKVPVEKISRSRLTKIQESLKFIENEITS